MIVVPVPPPPAPSLGARAAAGAAPARAGSKAAAGAATADAVADVATASQASSSASVGASSSSGRASGRDSRRSRPPVKKKQRFGNTLARGSEGRQSLAAAGASEWLTSAAAGANCIDVLDPLGARRHTSYRLCLLVWQS